MRDTSLSMVRHRRPRRSRKHAGTKFLVVLLFAATAAITWQFARQPVSSSRYASLNPSPIGLNQAVPSGLESQEYDAFIAGRPSRPAYLYSVIPGGVASVEELRQAMERDPVVAREFQGFDFQRAHLVQVSEKQAMHVAYRMGDKVYWTRKKVVLHPGETLISDGKIVARTRCGNRIAMAALGPPAMVEPVEADFNQPLFSNDLVTREAEPELDTYAAALPVQANSLQPVPGTDASLHFSSCRSSGCPAAAVRPTLLWRSLLSPAPCCCCPPGWWECTGRPESRGANHKCELSGRPCLAFPIPIS